MTLIERIEAAVGPDRELFFEAFEAIHGARSGMGLKWAAFVDLVDAEAWLDAAMTLVLEGWFPGLQKNSKVPNHQRWDAWLESDAFGLARGCAATPALALTAACLKAQP